MRINANLALVKLLLWFAIIFLFLFKPAYPGEGLPSITAFKYNVFFICIMLLLLFFPRIMCRAGNNQEDIINQVENIYREVRARVHDYHNHLQVLYVFLNTGEYDEAKRYISTLIQDTRVTSWFAKTQVPAINALLYYKCNLAAVNNIKMQVELKTSLPKFKMPVIEFCCILGNVLDNAIEALQSTRGERRIIVKIREEERHYIFEVGNNGPPIGAFTARRLFESGYSTKGKRNRGIGLYITRNMLKKNGGTIEVDTSSDHLTIFRIAIKRGEQNNLEGSDL